ncbi:M16 family metallopeptidase [Hufsiella ginkgonis]|uniref:Insulinase family protein n=1 Tax=Hufsiella ginkgonis TaxID=2695274 RepID=A0A7K1Y2M0_9SPHI|nr:M16 family metallopeptidase [Hufsiella ginkgonis]MXV17328.1 insulinase family protein [Hufsiella ginkgonis]
MKKLLLFLLFPVGLPGAYAQVVNADPQAKYQWKEVTASGYTYRYVTNDPSQTRFYTLKNGLKVMLSVNKKEPKVRALIGVRAGSNQDPDSNTGLAHYLEHLLFKGTDKFGTADWAKEKPYLKSIDSLYEIYNKETDQQKRKAIYAEIDKTSGIAAKYAVANEYDKLMAGMGGQGTNAHTSVEETVYEEYVPSGSLDKFLALQSERFRNPVFRIFHTELEAVYEEKNRGLDNDAAKVQEAMFSTMFPTHNYGQHTTIGTIEHLKNPSLKEIRKFYDNYYVPGNMGIVLSGDFNPDEVIKKIDGAFSYLAAKPFPTYKPQAEKPITAPVVKDIYGPTAELVRICFRSTADNTRDGMLADLVSSILSNGKAGLLDLDLNKQQKVLGAGAAVWQFKDYGIFFMMGNPKQGQTLEEVKDLLLAEIEKVKRGEFDASLIKSIVNNQKLSELNALQNNVGRANNIMGNFIRHRGDNWDKSVAYLDVMSSITKKEVVDFANRFFKNNYSVIYKRKGEDKSIAKVEKPVITPVPVNKDAQSPFAAGIQAIPAIRIAPQWLDFKKDMQVLTRNGREFLYTPNKQDQIFKLYYYYDMGAYNDKMLTYAAQYLQFLGTDKKSSEDISKAFYDIACSFNISVGTKTMTVSISGLNENFDRAVALFEDLVQHAEPNEQALAELKGRILKSRSNAKTNRAGILAGLASYAQYGPENPFNYDLSNREVETLTAAQLVNEIHQLFNLEHKVLYYGPRAAEIAAAGVQKLHPAKTDYTPYPARKAFNQLPTDKKQVLFTDYDMVQAEMRWVRNSGPYDPYNAAVINVFNSYFGSTLFQVIRESKALAYSTSGSYVTSGDKTIDNSITAYVGSQADKFNDATAGMNELLTTLPESGKGFEAAKSNVLNSLETQRISQEAILTEYLRLQKLGIAEDVRKTTYEKLAPLTFGDIRKFHAQNFSGQPYTLVVLGSEKKLAMTDLEKLGPVQKVSLEELFGY